MSYTFDDAVHVLGLDLTDDDMSPESEYQDIPPGDPNGYRYEIRILWDGDPEFAPWYASTFGALARKHVPGVIVEYTDYQQQ